MSIDSDKLRKSFESKMMIPSIGSQVTVFDKTKNTSRKAVVKDSWFIQNSNYKDGKLYALIALDNGVTYEGIPSKNWKFSHGENYYITSNMKEYSVKQIKDIIKEAFSEKRKVKVGYGPMADKKPLGIYRCDSCGKVILDTNKQKDSKYKSVKDIPLFCDDCEGDL